MMARLRAMLAALQSSVVLRLTMYYSGLAVLTSLVLLIMFYSQTTSVLESLFARQVTATAQRLSSHFEQSGMPGLIREIELELTDLVNAETEILAVVSGNGTVLTGNLQQWDDVGEPDNEGVIRTARLAGRDIHSHLVTRPLPSGDILVVGQDVRDLHDMTRWLNSLILAAAAVTLLMTAGGVLLFRRALQKRVEVIRSTANQIGQGQLAHRVPQDTDMDEFALLTRDINQMLDRIERLMTGVRDVSDAVAHNLRTPIARILSRLRSSADATDGQTQREAMAYAIAQLEDLNTMTAKLLSIAEMESGMRRKSFEPVDIGVIATDMAALYSAAAEDAGMQLIRLGQSHALVPGDRDLLSGAIANLLDNALKYAGKGATIRVSVANGADGIIVIVADDGPGVAADRHARLGERFYRAGRGGQGFGLGLASVQAVAQLHSARLTIVPARPGFAVRMDFPANLAER